MYVPTGTYFGDIKAHEKALREAAFMQDQANLQKGLVTHTNPEPSIQRYFKKLKKFYGLTSKYKSDGSLR
jgi:hypothetical protein